MHTGRSRLFLLLSTCALFYSSFSPGQPSWTKKPFEKKVFIENIGQFDKLIPGARIFFGANSSGVMILFTDQGIYYSYRESIQLQWLKANNVIPRLEETV